MTEIERTGLPLPDHFESFVVRSVQQRGEWAVQGFAYDPDAALTAEHPGEVVIGAGNTYAQNIYGEGPLHVAHDIHVLTGLPVVSLETVGAHGRTQRLGWRHGWSSFEHSRMTVYRESLLAAAGMFHLFERPLHHEGHSQAAFQAAARPAAAHVKDGIHNRTLTLFDPSGMRNYPKIGVLPRVSSVIRDYEKNHKKTRRPFEPVPEAIAAYAAAHPEIAAYHFPADVHPEFILERVGARDFTAMRLIEGLLANPKLVTTLISCSRGNGGFTGPRSEARIQRMVDSIGAKERFHQHIPEGMLHQWADRPLNRARLVAASISRQDVESVLAVD